MSLDHLYFAWSVDPENGKPWVQHECADGEVLTWRLPPPWRIEGTGIAPSLDCKKCGRHVILHDVDRVPWEAIAPAITCTSQREEQP